MFKSGDIVVYGAQGICKIDRIETKQIGKTADEYYVLKPVYNENTAVFVPSQNETLISRMQSILTPDGVQALISAAETIKPLDIPGEENRAKEYKEILSSADRKKLVSLIKTLSLEKSKRRENGKKLNINDEQILNKAKALLYNEIAFVMQIEPEQVSDLIKL